MQFQVPQFIDTEDKLIGPLTLKQFAYIAFGAIFVFFFYFILEFWLWTIITGTIALLVVSMAFLKINGRSFLIIALAILNYFWKPRLYLFQDNTLETDQSRKKAGGWEISLLGLQLNTFIKPLTERHEKSLRPSWLDRFRGTTKEQFEMFRKVTGEREIAKRVDYK